MPWIELEDFGILSVTIIFGLIGAIWGAIFGGFILVLGAWQFPGVLQTLGLAAGIIVLAFAFFGAIAGGLTALFYNLLARVWGGVTVGVNLQDVQKLREELNSMEMERCGVGLESEDVTSEEVEERGSEGIPPEKVGERNSEE